jgi:large subunit ribosomal protein L15
MQGGHGNAGWKRHRWSSVIRYGWIIGKKGFVPVSTHPGQAINIGELNLSLEKFLEQGQAKQVENRVELDLGQLGYTKLLGDGKISRPIRVTVDKCSEKAAEKIGQAGGEVVLPERRERPATAVAAPTTRTKPKG